MAPAARKPRVRRKAAIKAEPIEAAPAAAPARFVEVTKTVHARKTSWVWVIVQLAFASVLVVGAFVGYHELARVREESAARETALRAQLGEEVGSVQERFDSLMALWDRQKETDQAQTERKEETLPLSRVVVSYPAFLSGMASKDGKTVFAANPDLWIEESTEFKATVLVCAKPLQITADGYCDNVAVAGQDAVERVTVEREGESVSRVVRSVAFVVGDESKVLVKLNVDLGSPVVKGRDVFAPTDTEQQEASLESFLRALLKKESLPAVLNENISLFEDLIAHLRLP